MPTDLKFPLTNLDLAPLLDTNGFYRFGASIDEYWQLLADAEYSVEYADHQIITTMSYENDIHSRIAGRFNTILNNIFDYKPGFLVYNSNRPVYIPNCTVTGTGAFNADGMVVSMPAQRHEYRPGMNAETTPILLVEILSDSTRSYDFGTKLPCYKQIPSLQVVLFVEQNKPEITVFERLAPNRWTDTVLKNADDTFAIAGQEVTLRQVYRDVFFGE